MGTLILQLPRILQADQILLISRRPLLLYYHATVLYCLHPEDVPIIIFSIIGYFIVANSFSQQKSIMKSHDSQDSTT